MDLSNHLDRAALVAQIEADVDAYCREAFPSEHRTHLGASVIADPCAAKGWNTFRHLKLEQHSGQMRRLFERGHLEESRFVAILRGIGFDVKDFADDGKQFRISGANGHFGGSLDAMAKAPARYNIPHDLILLNEYKTHNEKSFTKLAGKKESDGKRRGGEGVRASKPTHYGQMCSYGRAYGFRFALYVAVNKNTDELYWEIVELDWRYADDLFLRAETTINSQTQPAKISKVATFFGCKFCHFSPLCHQGEKPEKNCRSCVWAEPIANAEWLCTMGISKGHAVADCTLSKEQIALACDDWHAILNG